MSTWTANAVMDALPLEDSGFRVLLQPVHAGSQHLWVAYAHIKGLFVVSDPLESQDKAVRDLYELCGVDHA